MRLNKIRLVITIHLANAVTYPTNRYVDRASSGRAVEKGIKQQTEPLAQLSLPSDAKKPLSLIVLPSLITLIFVLRSGKGAARETGDDHHERLPFPFPETPIGIISHCGG
jgi:hypothetical protein